MSVKGWGILQQGIEDERRFYDIATVPTGSFWDHTWLQGYNADDRGYSLADDLCKTFCNNFNQLVELTSSTVGIMPAMERELLVMKKLTQHLERVKGIVYEQLPGAVAKRGKAVFLPEEWATVSDSLSRLRIYMDYRNGYNLLRLQHFVKEEPIRDLAEEHRHALKAFVRKWYEKFYPGKVEEWGYITFCAVDAHDNTVLPAVLESQNPDEILTKEIPEKGINRVILNSENENIQKRIEESLKLRAQTEGQCTVNMLKMRLNKRKMEHYAQRIYGEERQDYDYIK